MGRKKERLKKKSKIKILSRPGIIYYLELLHKKLKESLGNEKNVIKYIVPRPGIIQSSCELSGFEPGTFRSSV